MDVIHKATARAAGDNPFLFVMSDATVDRYGDVIDPRGWKLSDFTRNPVALFGHDSGQPIGVWRNVRVEGDALIGELDFLPAGRSARVDELRAFVETGMLRAVSVGFRPLKGEPIPNSPQQGTRYTASDLVECSLVSIPANPNALAVAKQLHLSDDVRRMVFGKSADETASDVRRRELGETAAKPILSRTPNMTMLSQRIQDAQNDLVTLRDNLTTTINDGGDIDAITTQIEQKDAALASLKRAEKALGEQAGTAGEQTVTVIPTRVETRSADRGVDLRRPFAIAAKKIEPAEYVLRAATVQLLAHFNKSESPDAILRRAYGDDEATKTVFAHLTKAATAPATTTSNGWASQLVQTVNADFMDNLLPASVLSRIW